MLHFVCGVKDGCLEAVRLGAMEGWVGTAGEEGVQAEGTASEWPDTKAEGRLGLQGGQGQGRERHPPCTSALGRGTPARSSHTASGSASCRPRGRRLHGWGKETHQQLFQKRAGRGEGFPTSGKRLLPSQVPPERGPSTSGGAVSLTSKSSVPQDKDLKRATTVLCSDSDP